MYTVYAIYNEKNGKIYIGQTIDLQIRLDQHNQGAFKGFTSRFDGLWVVIYSENIESRFDALKREKQLKSFQGRQFVKQYIPT